MVQDVRSDQVFHVVDGTSIASLDELGARLKRMSAQAFAHHVTSTRNDFATWVKDCMRDEALASRLLYSVDQKEMCLIIGERIAKIKAQNGESKRQERVAESHRIRDANKSLRSKLSTGVSRGVGAESARSPMDPPRLVQSENKVISAGSGSLPDVSYSIERMKRSVSGASYASVRLDAASYAQRSAKGAVPVDLTKSVPSDDRPSPLEQRLHGLMKSRKQAKIAGDIARHAAGQAPLPNSQAKQSSAKPQSAKSSNKGAKKAKHHAIKEQVSSEDSDKPIMALPFEAYKFPDSPVYLSSSQACDHESGIGCVKCGVMEFAIGLIVGLAVALVLARSMAWF